MKRGEGKSFGTDADGLVRDALRALLKRYDNNQTRLGEVLGVSQSAISAILSAKNNAGPKLSGRIAQELGVSLDELTGGSQGAGVGRWETLPWWETVMERARALFPQVSAEAWAWLGSLAGAAPPGADPWALGTIAATWDQATARARAEVDVSDANKTRVRRKSGSK